jgi:hypothetical protein
MPKTIGAIKPSRPLTAWVGTDATGSLRASVECAQQLHQRALDCLC